ncbi:Protein ltv1 [Paramarasmius palmivorus]|uniref:Protein ltv1 n=1 Tax=Paramarasmius palmivorus TaxID=297713 RepID=A0AAW0E155_9AGAR
MPPKSIFRQPGARHFQLVHRSQRDPLYHDPDASKHVLKEVIRENDKKGKSRADLESILSPADIDHDKNAHVGEAALYGIYYDDTEYDYMQHLRPIGVQEDGVESVLIEAPRVAKKTQDTKRADSQAGITLRDDLPAEVLPSTSELPRNYESQQAIPESISGFQPDMDPHLRQVLEALEDDAFVDDGMQDDFFQDLVQEGERGSDEDFDFDFREEGIPDDELEEDVVEEKGEPSTWEERFAEFKKAQKAAPQEPASDDELDFASEGGDTISGLPTMSVIGGKKRRRKGTSDASGYSMSSSSMYRNEALQTLDERFDQVLLKEYNEDEEDDDVPPTSDDDDEAPELITTREDFTSMMDEFLNEYEILGGKMKPKLAGDTAAEKLDTLRRAMGQDERVRHQTTESDSEVEDDVWVEKEEKEDRWDCETILTTYSNLENHPRLIRARESKPVPKIQLNPKTGLPSISETPTSKTRVYDNDSDDSDYSDSASHLVHQTVKRSKDETPEEKKARKTAVKAQQATRRAEKKSNKAAFGNELKAAKARASNQPAKGVRKL